MLRLLLPVMVCAAALPAQEVRYQLGLRVRAFERAFDAKIDDVAARKAVVDHLERAVTSFFATRLGEVARKMDEARHALSPGEPGAATRWADSLELRLASRFLDVQQEQLAFKLKAFYNARVDPPAKASLRLALESAGGNPLAGPVDFGIESLPLEGVLPLQGISAGDHRLRVTLRSGETTLAEHVQTLSFAKDLDARIAKVVPLAQTEITDSTTATLRGLARLVRSLARGRTLETDIHAAARLAELEALQHAHAGGSALADHYGPKRAGQFRLWLRAGRATLAVRVSVPKGLAQEKVPLVVAMHGAGGSENLFFDGYGAGKIVGLAASRGWMLVAPRSPGFTRGASIPRLVDELAKLYPVDTKRVFAVGHSMGAMQAVSAVSRSPEAFAAVAALGGGGRVRGSAALEQVPFFVAPGDRDFALRGARQLRAALRRAGVATVRYREYEATEHMGIVQVALADVFTFFDGVARQ